MGQRRFELTNRMVTPATDDDFVEALLAFANSREVVIWHQPPPLGEVRAWSRWRVEPSPDERDSVARYVQRLIEHPQGWLPYDAQGRPGNALIEIPVLHPGIAARPDYALLPDQDFATWLAHMHEDTKDPQLVLVAHRRGYSPVYYRRFRYVSSALALAMLLVMDQAKSYRQTLSRCKQCQRFYLARRNPKGGPANRTYCSPRCRDDHHNSYERKSAARTSKARHK